MAEGYGISREMGERTGINVLRQRVRNRLYESIFSDIEITSVFEIGVGKGEFPRWCKGRGIRYLGYEKDRHVADTLRKEKFKILKGEAPTLPDLTDRFDCVYAAHLIEHLSGYPQIMELIENSKRLLKPGGCIIFLYPDIEKCGMTFYYDYTHTYPTSKRRVEQIMQDSGLHIVKSSHYVGCIGKPAWLLHIISKMVPSADFKARVQMCGMTVGRV